MGRVVQCDGCAKIEQYLYFSSVIDIKPLEYLEQGTQPQYYGEFCNECAEEVRLFIRDELYKRIRKKRIK